MIICGAVVVAFGYNYMRINKARAQNRTYDSDSLSMIRDSCSVERNPDQNGIDENHMIINPNYKLIRRIEVYELNSPKIDQSHCTTDMQTQYTYPHRKYSTLPNKKFDLADTHITKPLMNSNARLNEDDIPCRQEGERPKRGEKTSKQFPIAQILKKT